MTLTRSESCAGRADCAPGALLRDSLPGIALALLVLASFLFLIHPHVLRHELIDPDSYMHVVRLESVLGQGGWQGGFFPRDNAPYGTVLHWSKAYDLIFLALAAPLAAFAGWHRALVSVAPAIGPLSLIALILAAVWAVRVVADAAERRLLGMVIATTPLAANYGMVGCATYHVEIVAAWALFMGFALRTARPPHCLGDGIAAGLSAAFALWLTVECILAVALGLMLVGLVWVCHGLALRRASLGLALSLALGVILLLAWDPPYGGWRFPELERLSIVYAAFTLLYALLAAALAAAPQDARAWRARLAVAVAGAVLAAGCLALLFPSLLAPERAVFGAALESQFWVKIEEMKPAFSSLGRGLLFMTGPALGLAAALAFALRGERFEARAGWACCAAMIVLLGIPGLLHVRFAIYPEAAAALPTAVLMVRLHAFFAAMPRLAVRLLGGTLALTAVLLAPVLLAGAAVAIKGAAAEAAPPECAVRKVAAALDDPAFMGGRDLIIMTEPDQAPETLYWTDHRVVAGPYHLNVEGLTDVVAFMTGADERKARAILTRRGVAYVMICARAESPEAAAKENKNALWERLLHGDPPPWLVPQPWPGGVKSDLKLFRVAAAAKAG